MVLGRVPERAFVVPDLATWMLGGRDPLTDDLQRVATPERAAVLVAPRHIPSELAEALRDAWSRLPGPRRDLVLDGTGKGLAVEPLLRDQADANENGHGEHSEHEHHHDEGHGGDDHHDMMAIVGDPSEDGLIMEPLDFSVGPLAPSLPGGLIVGLLLDGDVVARARPRACLRLDPADPDGDALARLSWRVAVDRALHQPSEAVARRQVIALEVERALSHALNLQELGNALGWHDMSAGAFDLARALLPARRAAEISLREPAEAKIDAALVGVDACVARLERLTDSGLARGRLGGRAVVAADAAREHKIGGPIARAAGVDADERAGDALYETLGFEPHHDSAGDAEGRTRLRVAEIASAVELARRAATERGAEDPVDSAPPGLPVAVEGPRGSLLAVAGPDGRVAVATPGATGALEIAGEAIVGLEFGAAVAALVSFDLSPWRVEG